MSLSPLEQARRQNSPPLQGSGRGWGFAAERLDELGAYARDMRRAPTEPEQRLWAKLSRSQLGGHKFRRQSVIGSFIVDFLCPRKALVIEVDGYTHEMEADRRRDAALEALGFAVLHVGNVDVMTNIEGVCEMLLHALDEMPDRWASPHPNPSLEREGLRQAPPAQQVAPAKMD